MQKPLPFARLPAALPVAGHIHAIANRDLSE